MHAASKQRSNGLHSTHIDLFIKNIILVCPTCRTPAVGGLIVCECVCVSEDMSPYYSAHDEWLIMKLCMYVGYHMMPTKCQNLVVTK